jgi:replicative DNA helicase
LPVRNNESPHSVEAEMAVLSSVFNDEVCLIDCERLITPEYFFVPRHKTIYLALLALQKTNVRIDLITVTSWLRDRNTLAGVGGAGFLTDVATYVPTAVAVEYYLNILVEHHLRRQLIEIGREQEQRARLPEDAKAQDIISESQTKLIALAARRNLRERTIDEIGSSALAKIIDACDHPGEVPGLTTGLPELDAATGGLRPEHLIVICGATSEGKTALAFGIALRLAVEFKVPCGYVSLEMSGEELIERGVARLAKVNMHEIMTHGTEQADALRISEAIARIRTSPLVIRDVFDISVPEIRAIARQLKHQHKIQLLVIDYVQLVRQTDPDRREAEISGAALSLKGCAKELQIPVIVLSQLSDEGKLAYARAIGHHADKLIRIDNSGKRPVLSVDKNRGGPRKVKIPVKFNQVTMVFEDDE